jgi:Ca-activated chloride channel family protein
MSGRALAVLLSLAGLALQAAPQTPAAEPAAPGQDASQAPPAAVFRAGVETVPLYVTVLDSYGELVQNLGRDDFEVYDEGRRQDLSIFKSGFEPITAMLLIDTSASMTLNLDLERNAAEQFVIRMMPGDRARVGTFSDRVDLSPRFTGDRDELLRNFGDDLHFGNPTRLWDALDETLTDLMPLGGRRIVLVMTDGMDTLSKHRGEDVLARARTDDVMVYAVQFRPNLRANLAELPISPSAGALLSGDPHTRNMGPDDTLRRLSNLTGGGHFTLGAYDNVNATFTHLMEELHYQYVLGFTPQHLDGKVHPLEVRVTKPDVVVRARTSYVARRAEDRTR